MAGVRALVLGAPELAGGAWVSRVAEGHSQRMPAPEPDFTPRRWSQAHKNTRVLLRSVPAHADIKAQESAQSERVLLKAKRIFQRTGRIREGLLPVRCRVLLRPRH